MRTFRDEARVNPDAVGEPPVNLLLTITPQHCLHWDSPADHVL